MPIYCWHYEMSIKFILLISHGFSVRMGGIPPEILPEDGGGRILSGQNRCFRANYRMNQVHSLTLNVAMQLAALYATEKSCTLK